MRPKTTLEDLIGIEHSKLGFFQELRQKIEELKHSNKESEDQRREIAAILDGITDIMMVLSEDLRIISVNHVFREVFNEPEPEGKYCYAIFRGEDKPCPECPAFKSLSTNSVYKETAFFNVGEENRQFEMIASPLKNPEWPQHRVLIFKRDVTMEKVYQAKFYQAEKMATIGVLAAGVAHEVNNPLAAVAGFAEGIRRRLPQIEKNVDAELVDDFYEYTDTILKECSRCRDIVQALLSFSRPISSAFSPVSLNDVVKDTVRLLQHHLKQHPELTLNVELQENLPLIYADAPQLKQVVLNLMTNALDAIGGDGTISVSTTAVNETGNGSGVRLMVEDSGCGIPPDIVDKLFEPFFTTKPVGKGIGIGLSTCYNIVQKHSGDISVKSAPKKGSRFIVNLPVQPELVTEPLHGIGCA
jgi:hypothetical protein